MLDVRSKTLNNLGVWRRTNTERHTGVAALRSQQKACYVLNQLEFFPGIMEFSKEESPENIYHYSKAHFQSCKYRVAGEGLLLVPAGGSEGCISFLVDTL